MTVDVTVQRAIDFPSIPDDASFQHWARAVLHDRKPSILTIRVVDSTESADLNLRFRGKHGATNVLSFAADLPTEVDLPLLGDIIICAPLVVAEAETQGKDLTAHWAHLVVHGVLHLLGFDHQQKAQAQEMESREISMLAALGFPDPYT